MHGPTTSTARRLAAFGLLCVGLTLAPGNRGEAVSPTPIANAHALPADPEPMFAVRITVTGYSSTPDQTDSTPFITASNTRVRPGVIALSRDLLREFTPAAPFGYGDRVSIPGVGVFRVEDTMNARFTRRADIWFESRGQARIWGKRTGLELVRLSEDKDDYVWRSAPDRADGFQPALAD